MPDMGSLVYREWLYGMIVYCLVTLGAGAASQPARQLRGGRRVAPPARAPRAAPARQAPACHHAHTPRSSVRF